MKREIWITVKGASSLALSLIGIGVEKMNDMNDVRAVIRSEQMKYSSIYKDLITSYDEEAEVLSVAEDGINFNLVVQQVLVSELVKN